MRSPLKRFRALYGASPLHLLGALASFAIIAVAVSGWFAEPAVSLKYILIWFAGAIVAHDLLLLPAYSALDRLTAIRRRRSAPAAEPSGDAAPSAGPDAPAATVPVPGRVYLRVPVILSGVLLLVFGPEILDLGDSTYHVASGQHQHVYLARYLAIVAVMFSLSALAYARARFSHARR
jgi:hypothetical protein